MRMSCNMCYFGDKCDKRHICDNFAPFDDIEVDDSVIDRYIEDERCDFSKRLYYIFKQEDRLQDYFG